MRSRIDVSNLLSITCIYEPELTSASKVVKIPVYLDHVGDPALFLVLVSIHVFFLNRDRPSPRFAIAPLCTDLG
jgi:hypothetical protein